MGGHVPRTRGDGQGHPLKGVPLSPLSTTRPGSEKTWIDRQGKCAASFFG